MRLFGYDIKRKGLKISATPIQKALSAVPERGWFTLFESTTGSWQRDEPINTETVLAFTALYSCLTLISADIGKLGLRLTEENKGIWSPKDVPAYSPVLRKPNRYQTRQQFIEQWMLSKLTHGNAYVLKERDQRGVVVRLYVLDPTYVTTLVATNGDVFYELRIDNLSTVYEDRPAVPASEIIHDRMSCLFHPLVGVSPIYACGLAAKQGLAIQNSSAKFFENGANPGGVLIAPAKISDETAKRLKDYWEKGFTGKNSGKVAVLGDGLKYERLSVNAVDADLIAQLKMSSEMVCSAFHVPAYKVGVGPMPTYQNAEVLNQIYYTDCLQTHIEAIEALLDEGLAIIRKYRAEFDLDDLLRLDSATKMQVVKDGTGAGILKIDEGRAKFNLAPVTGGDTPYLQQQNYGLAALFERDQDKPFAKPAPAAPAPVDEEARSAIVSLKGEMSEGFSEVLKVVSAQPFAELREEIANIKAPQEEPEWARNLTKRMDDIESMREEEGESDRIKGLVMQVKADAANWELPACVA
jgi:HK97 family phage portal protein